MAPTAPEQEPQPRSLSPWLCLPLRIYVFIHNSSSRSVPLSVSFLTPRVPEQEPQPRPLSTVCLSVCICLSVSVWLAGWLALSLSLVVPGYPDVSRFPTTRSLPDTPARTLSISVPLPCSFSLSVSKKCPGSPATRSRSVSLPLSRSLSFSGSTTPSRPVSPYLSIPLSDILLPLCPDRTGSQRHAPVFTWLRPASLHA